MKSIFYITMILLSLGMTSLSAMENNKRKLDDLYENPQAIEMSQKTRQDFTKVKDPDELVKLSVLYKKGRGVVQDDNASLSLLKQAVEHNHAEAKFKMARLLKRRKLSEFDQYNVVSLLQQAAQQGYVRAQYDLGMLYLKGNMGLNQDTHRAEELLLQAADQGNAEAQNTLGLFYLGRQLGRQNLKKAADFLQLAAQQDHPESQFFLANVFYRGSGVTQDINKAVTYWQRAAHLGHEQSQLLLGRLYKKGYQSKESFIRDYNKALFYLMLIVVTKENEDEESIYTNEAQFILGKMYEKGKGVEKDCGRAAQHYKEIRSRIRRDNDEDPYGVKAKKRLKKLLGKAIRE